MRACVAGEPQGAGWPVGEPGTRASGWVAGGAAVRAGGAAAGRPAGMVTGGAAARACGTAVGEPVARVGGAAAGGAAAGELCVGCALGRADFDAMAAMEARFYGEDLITPAQEAWRWYERYPFTTLAGRDACGRIAGFINLFPVREPVYEALIAGVFNDAELSVEDVESPCPARADQGECGGAAASGVASGPAITHASGFAPGPTIARAPGAVPVLVAAPVLRATPASGAAFAPGSALVCAPAPALHMLLSCVVVDTPWQGSGLAYRLAVAAATQYEGVAPRIQDVVIDTATPAGAKFARNLGFVPICTSDHGTMVWRCSWRAFTGRLG